MRRLLCLVALVVVPLLLADEKKGKKNDAAPNTLTKDEIAKGWLLFFDGETTFGWKIDGEAKVEKGVLILGGKKETKAAPTVRLRSFAYRFECLWTGASTPMMTVGPRDQAIPVRPEKAGTFATNYGSAGGGLVVRAPFTLTVPAGSTLQLRNVKLIPTRNTGPMNADATVVTDQGFTSLFNGKDLKGWTVFKDKKREKSKYTVTKEGWLNVKDGPGDLQTEKKFDDFVLQLDCISNGKHLNSGIFFRCLPGEYQMGYEAQIRNEFKDKPTQKYTVEDFDPKTNKSTGKKEIMSTAVDYGTGAIYRRMPARLGVTKDREWFTMTVVARGRHLATWVNGIQMVDWTDNRPEAKNARMGYYDKAGPISIQGHDPTTDLSFRNIRIGELPRPTKK